MRLLQDHKKKCFWQYSKEFFPHIRREMPEWVVEKTQICYKTEKISKSLQDSTLLKILEISMEMLVIPWTAWASARGQKTAAKKNGFLLFSGLFANLWSFVQFHISGLLFLWHCFSHNCGLHFLPRWGFELLVPSHRYWSFNFLTSHSPTIARRNYDHKQIFH